MMSFLLAWFSSVRPVQVVSVAVVVLLLVAPTTPISAQVPPPPTSCGTPTPAETEGPYFKAGSPDQSNLDGAGQAGTVLHLTGYVTDTSCRPVAGALVD